MARVRTVLAGVLLVWPLAGCAGLEVTMPSSTPSETASVPATPTGDPTASPTASTTAEPTASPSASGTASPTATPSATDSPRSSATPSASPGSLEIGLAAVELRQGGEFTYKANGAAPADDYAVQATCTGGSTARITFTVTVDGDEAMFGGLSCDGAWAEFAGYDALQGLRRKSPDVAIDVQREGTISGGLVRVVPAGTPPG